MTDLREAFGMDFTVADYANAYDSNGNLSCCANTPDSILAVGKSRTANACQNNGDPTGCDGEVHCIPYSEVVTDTSSPPAEGWVICESDDCVDCADAALPTTSKPCEINGKNICTLECSDNSDCVDPFVCMDVGHLPKPHCLSDVLKSQTDEGQECSFETGEDINGFCVDPQYCGCSSYDDESVCKATAPDWEDRPDGEHELCTWDDETETCSIMHDDACSYNDADYWNNVHPCCDLKELAEGVFCSDQTNKDDCEGTYECGSTQWEGGTTDGMCEWHASTGKCEQSGTKCDRDYNQCMKVADCSPFPYLDCAVDPFGHCASCIARSSECGYNATSWDVGCTESPL